jgi:hypothetical protein
MYFYELELTSYNAFAMHACMNEPCRLFKLQIKSITQFNLLLLTFGLVSVVELLYGVKPFLNSFRWFICCNGKLLAGLLYITHWILNSYNPKKYTSLVCSLKCS